MLLMRFALGISALTLPFSCWSATFTCDASRTNGTSLTGYVLSLAGGHCTGAISPTRATNSTYRAYQISDNGLFSIFESVDGPENTSTGARSYFLFPFPTKISLSSNTQGDLTIDTGSGSFVFSAATTHLQSIAGATFIEDPAINMSNQGGVEIQSFDGLLLDSGWILDGVAYAVPGGSSIFRDSTGHTCSVTNTEVFIDAGAASQTSPAMIYPTNEALAQFLAKRCPTLNLNTLLSPFLTR